MPENKRLQELISYLGKLVGKGDEKRASSFAKSYIKTYPQWTEWLDDYLIQGSYAQGGIASGPTSGYTARLHGTEAIIPLKNGRVPVEITGGSNSQPIYVTVEIAGEEFEAMIDRRADNIRVKAQKRKGAMNERRAIY
jgi:hypothetical protein